ncbi:nucleotidyltransferase domain-containing protein [Pseudomonas sp. R2.Fl]|nr:nucleotidyltransferase domain-containing protein [Pseudomonas sp. R2.Fl]
MSRTLPPLHQAFVERVRATVSRDRRLTALLAGGSYVHGGFDRYSDLDFVVVVESGGYPEVMATRRQFAESLGELLSAFSGEHVGEPRLLICLYGPSLLHVDLKFIVADDLDRLVERPSVLFARNAADIEARLDAAVIHWPERSPDWFEQRAWTWLHYGAAKLGRGELFEAMGMLAFFRDQVLGPMLHRRAGRPQRGLRRMETSDNAASELLARTVAAHDADSIRNALTAAAEIYLDLRDDGPPGEVTSRMPELLLAYLEGGTGASSQARAGG